MAEEPHLRPSLDAVQIGALTLARRIFMPAHSYNFASTTVGRRAFVAYVERRLVAGVPLVIIGEAEVTVDGMNHGAPPGRVAGATSRKLYREMAALMRRTGGHVFEQLHHPGGQVWFEEQRPGYAPSLYPQPRSYVLPLELDDRGIRAIRQGFLKAARVCWEEGLSGVEVKADQGKLVHQFLSREFNHRTDRYGGSLLNRARLLREILADIRHEAPPNFVVGLRISGAVTPPEPQTLGVMSADLTEAETLDLCTLMQGDGAIDYLSLSGETNSTVWGYRRNHGDEGIPETTFVELARRIKSKLHMPLLLAGRFLDLGAADSAINTGACDAVGMARALIADAELLQKALSPSSRPVRPCISCNISCVGRTWYGHSIACAYDPLSGRESLQRRPTRAPAATHFAVIGAGPAGLEFARTASSLGARVTLFERRERVGGNLLIWARTPFRARLLLAVKFWEDWLAADPLVSVKLNSEMKPDSESEFTGVVEAFGAIDATPVFRDDRAMVNLTAREALEREDWQDVKVAVIDGDRYQDPLGIALYISRRGGRVRVISPFDQVGVGSDPVTRASRISELDEAHTIYNTWSDVRFAESDGASLIFDHCRNRVSPLDANVVVWCLNPLPVQGAPSGVRIGDRLWPRGLEATTREAFDTATSLMLRRVRGG